MDHNIQCKYNVCLVSPLLGPGPVTPRLTKSRIIHSGVCDLCICYQGNCNSVYDNKMDGHMNVTEGQELESRVVGLYGSWSQTRYQIGWFLVLLNHDNETTIHDITNNKTRWTKDY